MASLRVAQHHVSVIGTPEQDGELHVSRIYADVLINNFGPSGSANNILFLAHLVGHFNYVDDRKPVGHSLGLSQIVFTLSSAPITQDLGLSHILNAEFPIKITIEHPMGLAQATSTPHRAFVTDTLALVSSGRIPLSAQSITHTMNIVDVVPNGVTSTEILFTQQASFGRAYYITQDLGITQNLHLEGIWIRTPSHTNFLGHALTWYEDTLCGKKQYNPFQGETSVPNITTIPPSDILQDPQGDTGNFSLYQPYLGVPLKKVILRKPEMDNRDRNAYERISEETRGGDLIVYADPDWPKIRTLAVTVVGLTEIKVDELQDFMLDTVGEEIGLTDWEGRLWKGYIINPNEPATQDNRDRWTITFEFQGELLDVWQAGDVGDEDDTTMNITQAVTAVIV